MKYYFQDRQVPPSYGECTSTTPPPILNSFFILNTMLMNVVKCFPGWIKTTIKNPIQSVKKICTCVSCNFNSRKSLGECGYAKVI